VQRPAGEFQYVRKGMHTLASGLDLSSGHDLDGWDALRHS